MLDRLRDGRWLDEARVRRVAALSLALGIAALAWLVLGATGTVDAWGRPIGTDFSNVWTAGRMALDGRAAAAWDWPSHHAVQVAAHGRADIPFYGWHYPPPFLLLASLLATLPYAAALVAWQATTLAAALAVVKRIVPGRSTLLAALGAPVAFICLGHGHNGFLTAALFGGGMLLLDRRPFVAGLLLGCLVYKPQFALVLPLVLVCARQWRAVLGAALSSAALVAATLAIWGWPVWQAFLDSLPLTRSVVIEAGTTGWEKIQTPFGAVRGLGGSVASGYAVQGATTLTALLVAGLAAWRGTANVRAATALAAALLSTPYAMDYDQTLAGVAIAFLVADARARGWLDWEKTLLAAIWLTPLLARQVAAATLVPLGAISLLVLLALAARRLMSFDVKLRAPAKAGAHPA